MFRVTARKQASTELKVTNSVLDHLNSSGSRGKRGPGARALQEPGERIVTSNLATSGRVFISFIESITAIKLHCKTANRVKSNALRASVLEAAGFHMLDSLTGFVARDYSDSITDVQVSFFRVACPPVVLMSALIVYGCLYCRCMYHRPFQNDVPERVSDPRSECVQSDPRSDR